MSERKRIDCTGMTCPQPVLQTRDALAELDQGSLEVVVDNEASKTNVQRFALDQGCEVTISKENGHYVLCITPPADRQNQDPAMPPEAYTCDPGGSGLVYVFSSDTMGHGDDELGRILMRAFIKTIGEITPRPVKLLFYNTGVHLTSMDSDLIAPLQALEQEGVELLSCGTCLDFFNRKDQLLVGRVTNMFEIMDSMATASKVISPL